MSWEWAWAALGLIPVGVVLLGNWIGRQDDKHRAAAAVEKAIGAGQLVEEGSTDGYLWARAFVTVVTAHPDLATDEDCMIGWFACAIENGKREGRRETCPHKSILGLTNDLGSCRRCGKLFHYAAGGPVTP